MPNATLDTRRMTGWAGFAAALVFAAGNALWALDQPPAGASSSKVLAFYSAGSTRIVIGGSLSLVAMALLVLFGSGLRSLLREHEADDAFGTAAFGGALLAAAAGTAAETINMVGALRAGDGSLTPELGRALFEISYVFGYNGAGVGLGVLILATAVVALRARALVPRPAALLMVVAGIAFLTPLSRFLLAPGVLVLAAVSARLVTARAPEPE